MTDTSEKNLIPVTGFMMARESYDVMKTYIRAMFLQRFINKPRHLVGPYENTHVSGIN